MTLKINEKFAPRANPPTTNYPEGSIKNESTPGAKDGTPLDADWGNDYVGFTDALLAEVGIAPSGNPDTALDSQRLDAIKSLHINDLSQAYEFETVAAYKAFATEFPVGKVINLLDRKAEFKVIQGTLTDTGFKIIKSDSVDQSIELNYVGALKASAFGVVGDGVVDDTQALAALVAEKSGMREFIDLEDLTIRITSQVNFDSIWVTSNKAAILKDFDGLGVLVTGGSYSFRCRGDIVIQGVGVGFSDGSTASTNPSATGIEFRGVRLEIQGKFESINHQGYGFVLNCVGNMNRTVAKNLHGDSNGMRGFHFKGTQDDAAVWDISTYSFGNYEGGVWVDDDFQGRQWKWYCYNEGSNNPSGLYGVYLGRLRVCKNISVYSEEQTLTGLELQIGANCENLVVFDMRVNRSANDSVETCSLVAGNGGLWSQAGISYESPSRGVGLTDDGSKFIGKKTYGSSSTLIMEERVYGSGIYERQVNARTNGVEIDRSVGQSLGDSFNYFGLGYPQSTSFKYEGNRLTPADIAIGNVFAERHYGLIGGSTRELTRIEHELDDIVTANRGTASINFYTTNNDLSVSKKLKIHPGGDIEVFAIAAGLIMKSPDGTRYKLTAPNGGGAATWVAA